MSVPSNCYPINVQRAKRTEQNKHDLVGSERRACLELKLSLPSMYLRFIATEHGQVKRIESLPVMQLKVNVRGQKKDTHNGIFLGSHSFVESGVPLDILQYNNTWYFMLFLFMRLCSLQSNIHKQIKLRRPGSYVTALVRWYKGATR